MNAKPTTAPASTPTVAAGCRGVFFRSVISEDLDMSDVINQINFDQVRKQRVAGSKEDLFRPKQTDPAPPSPSGDIKYTSDLKSIGVLRVIKPRRFVDVNKLNDAQKDVNIDRIKKEYDVLLETTEFVLEEAQEQMSERFQLQETFGDFSVNFFGKRAEIFSYSGSLINAAGNLQWRNQFLANYENFLRGTKCAQLKARAYLLYDDVMREGFILSAGTSQSSLVEGVVKFNFTMLITAKRTLGIVPPSRSGSLTLDFKPSNKAGITEFEFFREVDPELPGVGVSEPITTTGGDVVMTPPQTASFIVNQSLPGTEPPDDLKQQFINKALKAIETQQQITDVQTTETSIDHDILIDFIPVSQLGSTTKLIISGARTLDVDNFDGDQLLALIIDGKLTVNDLKFKQAVLVADSLARTNRERIGEEGTVLDDLSKYFASNADPRITARVAGPELTTIVDPKKYVLEASLDTAALSSIITTTNSFKDFNQKAITDKVIENMSMSLAQKLAQENQATDFAGCLAFMAAMCLIPKSSGSLFTDITAVLPDAAGVGGKGNAIDYIKAQPVSKIKTILSSLPGNVSQEVRSSLSGLKATSLMQLINSRAGISLDDIIVNEAILDVASDNSLPSCISHEGAAFLSKIGILLTGIAAEVAGVSTCVSVDALGGTIRNASTDQMGEAYFNSSFVAGLPPLQDSESVNMEYGLASYEAFFRTSPAGSYVLIPGAVVLGSIILRGNFPGGGIANLGEISQTVSSDAILQKVGVVRITADQKSLLRTNGTFLQYLASKRRVTAVTPGSATLDNGVLRVKKMPMLQNHFGTSEVVKYQHASCSTIQTSLDGLTQVASRFSSIIDGASSRMTEIASGSVDRNALTGLADELKIEKFTSIAEVNQLKKDLDTIGVTVDNILDLLLYAKQHMDMAGKVTQLKSALDTAVASVVNDPENKAAAVAKDNQNFMNSVCA